MHISFDLDGTLINSEAIMRKSWATATERAKVSCGFDSYKKNIGLPFPVILDKLGLSSYAGELTRYYFDSAKELSFEIEMFEGADEIIRLFRNRDWSVSIITSKPRVTSVELVDRFNFEINLLVCGDDVSKGKPHPEATTHVKNKLSLAEPESFVYVGDTMFDIQFSINSNIEYVHFLSDKNNTLPVKLRNHVTTVERLSDLGDIL